MPQFARDPLVLQQWLNLQPTSLRDLFERAGQLARINRELAQWCDEPWLLQIHLVNIRDGALIVYSSSAAALVVLRQRQKSLLDFVNQRFGLACSQIDAKVRPGDQFKSRV